MTSSNGNIFRVTGPLCGEFTGLGEVPAHRPVTRSFDVFFDLRPNKRLSKQPWGWCFETLSWSLWRHCNGLSNYIPQNTVDVITYTYPRFLLLWHQSPQLSPAAMSRVSLCPGAAVPGLIKLIPSRHFKHATLYLQIDCFLGRASRIDGYNIKPRRV